MTSAPIVLALILSVQPSAQGDRWSARLAEAFQQIQAGRTDEAAAILDEVRAAAERDGDTRSLAEARRGQGRVAAARNDVVAATAAFADALRLSEQTDDLRGIGQARNEMGFAAWRKTDFDQALIEYTKAAAAFEKAGRKSDHANALRNMTFGRMPLAERRATLERALSLAREGDDRKIEGLILHALGDVRSAQGDQQEALSLYEKALALLETQGDPAVLARLLTSFGRLHRVHGDPNEAIPFYERAIVMLKTTTDRDAERQAEDALANAFAWLDRPVEGMDHAERALRIAEESRPALVAFQRVRVGEFALRAGDVDRALALLESEPGSDNVRLRRFMGRARALAIRGNTSAALENADAAVAMAAAREGWETKITAYSIRSDVHERAGRSAAAIEDAMTALRVLESGREGLALSDDFRVSFSQGYRGFYNRVVDLLAAAGRADEAQAIAESGRARALLDLLSARGVGAAQRPEVRATGMSPDENGVPGIAAGEALVSFWVTNDNVHAWVTRDSGMAKSFRIPIKRSELDALVARANSLSPSPGRRRGQAQVTFDTDPRPALRSLYSRVFAPLRPFLPTRRGAVLRIEPDGPLLGLSFAELLAPSGRYVIEDFTLQYAPSIQFLRRRAAPSVSATPDNPLLVSVSSGYPKWNRETFEPLSGVRFETDAVSRLFPPGDSTRMNDGEATEENVRRAMGRASIIHFATHAIASNVQPADSFLALRPGGGHDGRLTAGEILGLSVRAELVVLSACRGAAGRITGEGMLGLSRAWLAAGARRLVASVRELPDDSGAQILPKFYSEWRRTNDASSALRTAQLGYLKRLRAGLVKVKTPLGTVTLPEHPSLWAGLIVIGEP